MAAKRKTNRAWGGRFESGPAADAQEFTASISFDVRLYPYDIRASIAHARMLAACKIISAADRDKIVKGLRAVEKEIEQGRFKPGAADEDIHMAIERRLIEKVGAAGEKLHTARSRNDQVVTDVRLYLKDAIAEVTKGIQAVQDTLADIARRHPDTLIPGYTHMQRAQPVVLGHHLLAYHDMLSRDAGRLADCMVRVDVLPLGAGALAGTTLPIDPSRVAKELGFARVFDNSMDAVADRDFIIEFLGAVAILFSHLSRLAAEITLWATTEYGFVELHDKYSTGSSMMPQKKNPDIAELVRGKSGRVYGNLVSLLTTVKGLPLTYNSDLQEDKEPLFDSVDTAVGSLSILGSLLASLKFDPEATGRAAEDDSMLATDLAEYLVDAGVPFRKAHEITGRIVRDCADRSEPLTAMTPQRLRKFAPQFSDDVARILTASASVARRNSRGGTAPSNVKKRLRGLSARKPSARKTSG